MGVYFVPFFYKNLANSNLCYTLAVHNKTQNAYRDIFTLDLEN